MPMMLGNTVKTLQEKTFDHQTCMICCRIASARRNMRFLLKGYVCVTSLLYRFGGIVAWNCGVLLGVLVF